jgi:hypothetical protein
MNAQPLEPGILRNRARCKACGTIVESAHRHDFRTCACGKIAVDGGRDYRRRVGDPALIEELSEMAAQ